MNKQCYRKKSPSHLTVPAKSNSDFHTLHPPSIWHQNLSNLPLLKTSLPFHTDLKDFVVNQDFQKNSSPANISLSGSSLEVLLLDSHLSFH